MSKESVLERVNADIERGDYGKARDRLNSLIQLYPDDVSLRSRLAEVWWDLHYPAMAGRYWYLEEERAEEVLEAIEAFEKECGRSPKVIWHHLRYRGTPENLPPHARQRIEALIEACKKQGMYPTLRDGRTQWKSTPKAYAGSIGFCAGVVIVMALAAYLSVVGLVTLIKQWFG